MRRVSCGFCSESAGKEGASDNALEGNCLQLLLCSCFPSHSSPSSLPPSSHSFPACFLRLAYTAKPSLFHTTVISVFIEDLLGCCIQLCELYTARFIHSVAYVQCIHIVCSLCAAHDLHGCRWWPRLTILKIFGTLDSELLKNETSLSSLPQHSYCVCVCVCVHVCTHAYMCTLRG